MMYNTIIAGLNFLEDHEHIINQLKQRAIDEYKAALLMPRKKKKIAKKSAIMLYNIACWDPNYN